MVLPNNSVGIHRNMGRVCSFVFYDFTHYRSLLHTPLQLEAEEGADIDKGEAEGGGERVGYCNPSDRQEE